MAADGALRTNEPASKLVPQKESKGTGIFYNSEGAFIVRSDLGCYMVCQSLEIGNNIRIEKLHPACQWGDFYLSILQSTEVCVIKGDTYRHVKNLSTDEGAGLTKMHPNCCGGDYYMNCGKVFLIVFLKRGVVRSVTALCGDWDAYEIPLNPECSNGLYYFGIFDPVLIKMDDKWGAQFLRYKNISTAELFNFYSIHPDVLNFLPGGLALTKGSSFGAWNLIKSLQNNSNSSITWSDKVTSKVGYMKRKMSSIEHSWKISTSLSLETGALSSFLSKAQFSLSAEYGGKSVQTGQEDWSEARDEEESLQVTLKPSEKLYIWQYRLGIGKDPVLFCRDIEFTQEEIPPNRNPLPPVS
uniref:Uncharacterized protein n=1 Tax=Sphenodon punctatus TaxID=8508 RepID=A0A8D0GY05_SPHPU